MVLVNWQNQLMTRPSQHLGSHIRQPALFPDEMGGFKFEV
jgi:hypothetical protein